MAPEQSVHCSKVVCISEFPYNISLSLIITYSYILGHLGQHCLGGGGIGFEQGNLRHKTRRHSGLKGIALVNGDMKITTATAARKNFMIAINSG